MLPERLVPRHGIVVTVVALALHAALVILASETPPSAKTIHAFVSLADNDHQGIVPVPARLGNGEDPANNLYWGARFGVRSWFRKASSWVEVTVSRPSSATILESVAFRHKKTGAILVADAYRGAAIREAITAFLSAAGDGPAETVSIRDGTHTSEIEVSGHASLVAYVGHDGLMDFELKDLPTTRKPRARPVIVLACASKSFFAPALRAAGAEPLLWTTGLLAPEAYILEAALDGWLAGESGDAIRLRAAAAYDEHQKCGRKAAERLFATGW